MQTKNDTSKPEDSPQQEAGEGCSGATCYPVFLTLQEFTSGGSKYYRCADDTQRPLLSHLLNGAGACFFAEDLPTVQRVANAHGWVLQILLENS
jgi:hypothetical protein